MRNAIHRCVTKFSYKILNSGTLCRTQGPGIFLNMTLCYMQALYIGASGSMLSYSLRLLNYICTQYCYFDEMGSMKFRVTELVQENGANHARNTSYAPKAIRCVGRGCRLDPGGRPEATLDIFSRILEPSRRRASEEENAIPSPESLPHVLRMKNSRTL